MKLEDRDGEENPVDMRNVFPPIQIFLKVLTAILDWLEFVTNAKVLVRSRVSDPDPHGSELIWVAGYGSRKGKMTYKNRKSK